MTRRNELLLLGVVLALAAGLRFAGLGRESLWLDEGYSVRVASQPARTIVALAARDAHPPLYYLLLHGWIGLGGAGEAAAGRGGGYPLEAAVRSLSALAGLMTVVLAYALGRRLLGAAAGLAAALIVALAGIQLHYSQEARSYALLAMLAALSWWLAARFLAGGRRHDLAGMTLASIALVYTHHAGWFAVAAQALTPLAWRRERGARIWPAWLAAHAMVALAFLPWLGILRGQMARISGFSWVLRPDLRTLASTLAEHAGSPWLALLLLLLAAIALVRAPRRPGAAPAWAVALWLAIPVAAPFLISRVGAPVYLSRLTIVATVPLALLAAAGLGALPARFARAALVGVVLLAIPPLAAYENGPHRERWREAAADLERTAEPGDLVLFDAGYCLRDIWRIYARRGDLDCRPLPASPDSAGFGALAGAADTSVRVWLVRSHDGAAGEEIARRLLRTHPLSLEWRYPSRSYELWRLRPYLGIRVERFGPPAAGG